MKAIFLFYFVFVCNYIVVGQIDTVHIALNMSKYDRIAKEKLMDLYSNELDLKNSPASSMLLSNKYNLNELQTLSIPVFNLKPQAKKYKCGDNLELLIDFKEDPYFQKVIIIKNQKQVGGFNIIDSFNESNRIQDSIKGDNPFSLHSSPILNDNRQTEKKLLRYTKKNSDVFIFMIKGINGFWVVKNDSLYKLVDMVEESANKYFTMHYGEEYIHDVSNDALRTGYSYINCKDFNKLSFKVVEVMAEITE
jgi:hypothetical protein